MCNKEFNVSIEAIMREAVKYDNNDIRRINHFLKVYTYAKMIGEGEKLQPDEQYILETAAILHDIGIHESERKYNSCAGSYQEIEGPGIAGDILTGLGVDERIIDRVRFLVGHHHTYAGVDGKDYQILIEADFFVNADEDKMSLDAVKNFYDKIFRTETGKKLFSDMYF
ncbi:MAG: HD domain-containing protein [Lachnospiraceae bacterium]|nr:HD domain-containing protein [Lachnospiraceae bacterium]